MEFIRKLAVRGYTRELEIMIDDISRCSIDMLSDILVMAVWGRATLDIEGNLPVVKDEDGDLNTELIAYPIQLKIIEKIVKLLNRKGCKGRAFCYSIWVHTLRSILNPELSDLANMMWGILIKGKEKWDCTLAKLRDADIEEGIPRNVVLMTERHAQAILKCLPPKQLHRNY